jgi:thiamine biosynthesis protein ThiS
MNSPMQEHILLNGAPIPNASGLTLAQLLEHLGEPPDQVATALNHHFVPRDQRSRHRLAAGDHVTVFKAIVGG